ncbi:MAG TPA: hypothetical protein VGC57_05640 [Cellulomonas sp.]
MTDDGARLPHAPGRVRSVRTRLRRARPGLLVTAVLAACLVVPASSASAASYQSSVGLGTVGPYSVLAGSAVTNTGASVLSGELGVSPGSARSAASRRAWPGARSTSPTPRRPRPRRR